MYFVTLLDYLNTFYNEVDFGESSSTSIEVDFGEATLLVIK